MPAPLWTAEMVALLRRLWAEGHSTANIGQKMGVSKNAVVGKAHRLGLEPRPSPIRRAGPAAAPVRRVPRPRMTIPALPSAERAAPSLVPPPVAAAPAFIVSVPVEATKMPIPHSAEDLPRAVSDPPAFVHAAGGMGCQWPMWGFNDRPCRNPEFCGQPRWDLGCSYCARHTRKAHVSPASQPHQDQAA
jgi:GcrA cell cycle regulator